MRKISILPLLLLCPAFLNAGCTMRTGSAEQSAQPAAEEVQEDTASPDTVRTEAEEEEELIPEIPEETEAAPEKPVYKLQAEEGVFVYDGAGILSDEEEAEISSAAQELYEKYLINAAVVTADSIGGEYPYTFAQNAYDTIYEGRGSGFLLLINNDTNYDSLYRTGRCLTYISDSDEKEEFYRATKDIVGGDYKTAILRILELGKKCPEHVFDNIDALTSEQAEEIEKLLSGSKSDISLLVTTNSTDKTNDEVCRSYCDRRYADGNGYMLMYDADKKTFTIASGQDIFPEFEKSKVSAEKMATDGKIVDAVKEITGKLK